MNRLNMVGCYGRALMWEGRVAVLRQETQEEEGLRINPRLPALLPREESAELSRRFEIVCPQAAAY